MSKYKIIYADGFEIKELPEIEADGHTDSKNEWHFYKRISNPVRTGPTRDVIATIRKNIVNAIQKSLCDRLGCVNRTDLG